MSKKQGDQIHFYQEKARKKKINASPFDELRYKMGNRFINSTRYILSVSKRYHVLKKKCDDIKRIGSV